MFTVRETSDVFRRGTAGRGKRAPSSEHSNGVVGCSPEPPALSAPENVNLIELNDVCLPPVMAVPPAPLGTVALFIVVVGSPVSTVHVNDAGVESLFPTASTALTSNVCSPSERPVMSIGEEHPVAVNAPPSSEHSNGVVGCSPEPPALSAPENVNLIELNDVLLPPVMAVPPAPLRNVALFIVVVGSPVSTVHVNDAGVESLFPTASTDLPRMYVHRQRDQ